MHLSIHFVFYFKLYVAFHGTNFKKDKLSRAKMCNFAIVLGYWMKCDIVLRLRTMLKVNLGGNHKHFYGEFGIFQMYAFWKRASVLLRPLRFIRSGFTLLWNYLVCPLPKNEQIEYSWTRWILLKCELNWEILIMK